MYVATTMDLEALCPDSPATSRYGMTLADLKAAVPTYGDQRCITAVAALIYLDKHAGQDSDNNALVVHWSVMIWLIDEVCFVDAELGRNAAAALEAGDADKLQALLSKPFRVRFVDPDGQERYPVIDGLERTIRVLSDDELYKKELAFRHDCATGDDLSLHMFTARAADGEFL